METTWVALIVTSLIAVAAWALTQLVKINATLAAHEVHLLSIDRALYAAERRLFAEDREPGE